MVESVNPVGGGVVGFIYGVIVSILHVGWS